MPAVEMSQLASAVLVAVASSAGWGYFKDRRKSKAEGTVAAATVEIQVEGARVQNLEQRFAFAQAAWDEERESLTRQLAAVRDELAVERRERAEDKTLHEEKVGLLEQRLRGMQREMAEMADEIANLKRPT